MKVTNEELLDLLITIGSTAIPICEINGKIYHYMCKEEIVELISNYINTKEEEE